MLKHLKHFYIMKTIIKNSTQLKLLIVSFFTMCCITFLTLESHATLPNNSRAATEKPDPNIVRHCHVCGDTDLVYMNKLDEWGYFLFQCNSCGEDNLEYWW